MSERVQQHLVVWELVAAGACFAVAVIALVLGFVFTTHWLLDDQYHPLLHTLGLVLLIVGIPIMLLGAHFLDLQEKKLDDSRRNSTSAHIVGLVSVFLFIPLASVHAQQTIFNVPSTDVLSAFTENAVAGANRAGGQFGFEQPLNRVESVSRNCRGGPLWPPVSDVKRRVATEGHPYSKSKCES